MAEHLDDLLQRCRNGDPDAIEMLVRRFRSYGMDLALHITGDAHLAEDAVQEAFVGVFQRLGALRTPAAFPGWYRQIVRTQALRALRGRREVPVPVPALGQAAAPERGARAGAASEVRQAVAALPAAARDAATLFYLNGLDHHQVARALDIPPGTVKRRLHDARRHLRRLLPL